MAGPRSLYHCDAHEKLAKIWGFWVHLCIDGYSRLILYLVVTTDKKPASVRRIFREACDAPGVGWAARVRWDKGSENAGAIEEQLAHHQALGGDRWRTCAITGRSMQNCRAEYIWNFYKRAVSGAYRELFFRMMRQLRVLDVDNPEDLFCLQVVFLPRIQASSDRFRRMWNAHRIRGPRCVRGHGGGKPLDLFRDPVEARVLADDASFAAHSGSGAGDGGVHGEDCTYGVAEPFKGDTPELAYSSLSTRDPFEGIQGPLLGLLIALRTGYFETVSFASDREGIDEYNEYKQVCKELLALGPEGWVAPSGQVDFDGYGTSLGQHADSQRIRRQIAILGTAE